MSQETGRGMNEAIFSGVREEPHPPPPKILRGF